MKKVTPIPTLLIAGAMLFTASSGYAQTDEKKAKLSINISEEGENTTIEKEIPLDQITDLKTILEEMDVLNDFDLGEGEKIEISIRKTSKENEELKNLLMGIDIPGSGSNHWSDMAFGDFNKEPKGFLGVYTQEMEEESNPTGLKVTKIIEGTAAKKAGLQEGDIITAIDETTVTNNEELVEAVKAHQPGETVEVTYLREGKESKVSAELGERKVKTYTFNRSSNWPNCDDKVMVWPDNDNVIVWPPASSHNDNVHAYRYFLDAADSKNKDEAFLGISGGSPFGSSEEEGVHLWNVYENSTADELGLKKGDVIFKINGNNIKEFDDINKFMDEAKVGEKVKVEFYRDGKKMKAETKMKTRGAAKSNSWGYFDSFNFDSDNNREMFISIFMNDISKEEAEELSEKSGMDVSSKNTLDVEDISFFPNPTNGQFKLKFELSGKKDTQIMILDQTGKRVYEEKVTQLDGSYNKQIDISKEPSGIYYLMIMQGNKQYNQKIVKQ